MLCCYPLRRRSRLAAVALLTVVSVISVVSGCSASADYEAEAPKPDAPVEVPRWVRDGVRIAKATKAAQDGDEGDPSANRPTISTAPAKKDVLPSRDVVVAALGGVGMTPTQANCVYDGISASPQTAADVTSLINALASGAVASGVSGAPGGTFDAASIPALANLTPESTTRLLVTVAPCLDQATMLGLLAAGQGLGGAGGGGDAIAALLGQAQGLDLAKLAGFDTNAIAGAAAGALGPAQVQQLLALLNSVGSDPLSLVGGLAGIDITELDLSKITQEQLPLLVLALLKGLSGEQQGQLMKLAQVNLDQLNIKVDPDQLTPEEIGGLLLILSPLLAGAIKQTPATVPPGGDPLQIYIPPGADLSHMNPLIFLNRADVMAQFAKQGIGGAVAGCIFDGMAKMEASTIAAFFSEDKAPAAAGSVVLIAISCIAQGG